jgi:hypothetical protein
VEAEVNASYGSNDPLERKLGEFFDCADFTLVVVTTRTAYMMRAYHFTTIRALDNVRWTKCVVCPAHIALGLRNFLLWNSHVYNPRLRHAREARLHKGFGIMLQGMTAIFL